MCRRDTGGFHGTDGFTDQTEEAGVIERVVSGGQTGVDRAALDAALQLALPCGGWCPQGRRAEDGSVPDAYPMRETATADYAERTELNIRDSDGTLILSRLPLTGGTALTRRMARKLGRPLLVIDLWQLPLVDPVEPWLDAHRIRILNVAGPRESQQPGIHARALEYLTALLIRLGETSCRKPSSGHFRRTSSSPRPQP